MWKSAFFLLVQRQFHEFFAWLTHTGIQFPNGPWFSGMKNSSSRGFKNPQKLALGKKNVIGLNIEFPNGHT